MSLNHQLSLLVSARSACLTCCRSATYQGPSTDSSLALYIRLCIQDIRPTTAHRLTAVLIFSAVDAKTAGAIPS